MDDALVCQFFDTHHATPFLAVALIPQLATTRKGVVAALQIGAIDS
jgi:hypothetical protein